MYPVMRKRVSVLLEVNDMSYISNLGIAALHGIDVSRIAFGMSTDQYVNKPLSNLIDPWAAWLLIIGYAVEGYLNEHAGSPTSLHHRLMLVPDKVMTQIYDDGFVPNPNPHLIAPIIGNVVQWLIENEIYHRLIGSIGEHVPLDNVIVNEFTIVDETCCSFSLSYL